MANPREERENEILQKFLKSRKSEETKKYVQIIISYLSEQRGEHNKKIPRWVQSRDFIVAMVDGGKIPNGSTFYKLLKDLVDAGLIERKKGLNKTPKPGRPPVFYRVPVYYPRIWFLSRDELIKDLVDCQNRLTALIMAVDKHPDGPKLREDASKNINKIQETKDLLRAELLKTDDEINFDAPERMKNYNPVDNPDDILEEED